jgi:hypothetical protein
MSRRIKGAKSLYSAKNQEVLKYDRTELITLLTNRKVHSPEMSETDEEHLTRNICVYDLSWRSDRVYLILFSLFFFCIYLILTLLLLYFIQLKKLLRNVLDPHALTLQTAQLVRARVYDDKNQCYDLPHPVTAPDWCYVQQRDQVYDTDIEGKYIKLCLKLIFVINLLIFILSLR